jgi:hypothetical protein
MHETKYICGIYISDIIAQKTSETILVVLAPRETTIAVSLQIINRYVRKTQVFIRTQGREASVDRK